MDAAGQWPGACRGRQGPRAGEAVGGAGDRLAGLLVDTATALGWRGDAAAGASARAEQAGGQIQRLQQELGLVADALTRLGRAMDEHGTGIGSLARRRLVLVEQVTAAVDPRAGGGASAAGSQGPRAELAAVDRQIQVYVDELAAVDRATTAVLSGVAQLLRVLSSVELEGGWVATATDPRWWSCCRVTGWPRPRRSKGSPRPRCSCLRAPREIGSCA